jgi:hypothetical protein
MEQIVRKEPGSGGLVFSVFHPRDLYERLRPGYVPCLISGSFLVHQRELQLNAFFRSQSVIEFGLHDLLFLRRLQKDFLNRLQNVKKFRRIKLGTLSLFLGRAIVQRRIARRRIKLSSSSYRHVCLHREDVVPTWLEIVERHLHAPSDVCNVIAETRSRAGIQQNNHKEEVARICLGDSVSDEIRRFVAIDSSLNSPNSKSRLKR